MNLSKDELDSFYEWLKDDGLGPKKSERLWRKIILAKLLNADKMTWENFEDFRKDQAEKERQRVLNAVPVFDPKVLIGKQLRLDDEPKTIAYAVYTGSQTHLFFEGGQDLLISSKEIPGWITAYQNGLVPGIRKKG